MTVQHSDTAARSGSDTTASASALGTGVCATLACIWEATAPKPGNVYRGADFEDLGYADFLTSAAAIGPILDRASQQRIGETVLRAVAATQDAVATNTNLGIVLLMSPLAAVERATPLAAGIGAVLEELTADDTLQVYEAIRLAQPGGLDEVPEADVRSEDPPTLPLVEAMRLAADRDLVARQYVNQFAQVFLAADYIERELQRGRALGDAIVRAYLRLLKELPDSLIARKCGEQLAQEVSLRAARVLAVRPPGEESYGKELQDFDFWLRADGHRRNPGTTADLIAAGLFVLLREQRLDWPVRFYGPEA